MPPAPIAWATDLHLDQATLEARQTWAAKCVDTGASELIITGDISHADRIADDLDWIEQACAPMRIRFVLGNHDYTSPSGMWGKGPDYGGHGSIQSHVEGCVASARGRLTYLSSEDRGVLLDDGTLLLGVDGWFDGRAGAPDQMSKTAHERRELRADVDTRILAWRLKELSPLPRRVIIATHVPPFATACNFQGAQTNQFKLGLYCNVGLGRMLTEVADEVRKVKVGLTVLAGHTHNAATIRPRRNLRVLVQGVENGAPGVSLIPADPYTTDPAIRG